MIEPVSGTVKPARVEYASTIGWPYGVISRLDDDRTPDKAISIAENVELSQNGTIKQRPGLSLYGTQPSYPVLGQAYEFVKFNGNTPETYLICMQNVSGTGKLYYNKDGGAWTEITGNTYDSTTKARFEQIANSIVVMNGVDELSYVDIDTMTVTVFTSLSTPSISSVTPTGLTGSTYTLRYKVTATNEVGESIASSAGTATVSTIRDQWTSSQYVTLVFPRVTNADRYNLYFGDQAGLEYYFDSVVDPGSGANVTYVDTGTIAVNTTRLAPVENSTAGPIVKRATNIRGQLFMTGDTDNPARIWFGGSQGSTTAINFTFFVGGGWVEPNKGGKDFPVRVMPFRDGKGTPMAACLSRGTNGTGKRYLLQPSSTTVGDTIISYMAVTEDNGQDGTDSPDGVVILDDALWYPSREGFKTTTTKAQIQNILSTSSISANISDAVKSLSATDMENCVGVTTDRRIYWSVPFQSETNNQVWILDLQMKGAWMRPWLMNVDWMVMYADNSDGKSKLLFLIDDKFYVLDEGVHTNDNGTAFSTNIGSGAIKFSEDGEQYGSLIDFTFIILRPQGEINLTVVANTEDGPVVYTDVVPTTSNQSVGGYGSYGYGWIGYGNIENNQPLSVSSSIPRVRTTIPIDEECNYFTWAVNSVDSGVAYELATTIARYVSIGWVDKDNG